MRRFRPIYRNMDCLLQAAVRDGLPASPRARHIVAARPERGCRPWAEPAGGRPGTNRASSKASVQGAARLSDACFMRRGRLPEKGSR